MLDGFLDRIDTLEDELDEIRGIRSQPFTRSLLDIQEDHDCRFLTGFWSIEHFNSFLWFLCNGQFRHLELALNPHQFQERIRGAKPRGISQPKLDFRLEFYLYCLRVWRDYDAGMLARDFHISESHVHYVVIKWATIERRRWEAFGRFPTAEEYFTLRPEFDPMTLRYPNSYSVWWDTSNVDFRGKPSNAIAQKLTFSDYYGGNVLKGGVGVTSFGFNIAGDLWTAISDSDYLIVNKIFELQNDVVSKAVGSNVPVKVALNITDKGFRCDGDAAEHGQSILRAPLKNSEQLSPLDAIRTAFLASSRAINEQMVGRPFYFRILYNGIPLKARLDVVNYHWLNSNAKCNFIFHPLKRNYPIVSNRE